MSRRTVLRGRSRRMLPLAEACLERPEAVQGACRDSKTRMAEVQDVGDSRRSCRCNDESVVPGEPLATNNTRTPGALTIARQKSPLSSLFEISSAKMAAERQRQKGRQRHDRHGPFRRDVERPSLYQHPCPADSSRSRARTDTMTALQRNRKARRCRTHTASTSHTSEALSSFLPPSS